MQIPLLRLHKWTEKKTDTCSLCIDLMQNIYNHNIHINNHTLYRFHIVKSIKIYNFDRHCGIEYIELQLILK